MQAQRRQRSPLLAPSPSGSSRQTTLGFRLSEVLFSLFVAFVIVALAGCIRYALVPFIGGKTVFMMFFPAVMLSAWIGGLTGGLFAVAMSGAVSLWLFDPASGGIDARDPQDASSLIAFILMSASIAWGTAALRFSREQLAMAAAELAEKESRFQALFDILPVGISIAEDPECREIRHNPTLTQWLGHEPDINASLTGPRAGELPYKVLQHGKPVPPEDLPMPVAARTGVKYHHWEGDLHRADGSVIHVLGYATPLLGADGKVEGCLGTYVDISEVRRAEQERVQHQSEIETLNKQLQRSVSETHHRVKNNLQVITALLNMEIQRHEQAVPPERIRRIIHHVQSLSAIHDLLTYQSKKDAKHQLVGSKDAFDRLVPLVAALVVGRKIEYSADDVELTPRQATAVAILVNELIGNAIKHGQGDISARFTVDSGVAELEVADRGPGFPDGFDPLLSANTGLELVETVARWDLQGDTHYENRPDGGAKVLVEFPIGTDS
jgi:two-component sensor histidine kinase/PAS domain-containing protein